MWRHAQRSGVCLGAIAVIVFLPVAEADTIVQPGYDLFETVPGATMFMGVPFQGIPEGFFNFGGTIGLKNTGMTDTIVQRLMAANSPMTTVNIQMIALQLVSTAPTNFGGNGIDFYYLTLQSARGGPATVGTETINFTSPTDPRGTFSSFFDVFFDIRKGSVNGPIVLSGDTIINQPGQAWANNPLPGVLLIEGVNSNLKGDGTHAQDFFLIEQETQCSQSFCDTVMDTPVPEPASVALCVTGLIALGLLARRRSAV